MSHPDKPKTKSENREPTKDELIGSENSSAEPNPMRILLLNFPKNPLA